MARRLLTSIQALIAQIEGEQSRRHFEEPEPADVTAGRFSDAALTELKTALEDSISDYYAERETN